MTIKVTLRQKTISGKRKSLYLDFYPAVPHPETAILTRRKFLGLYILEKANTPEDKVHNKNILEVASRIRQNYDMQLNKPEIYTGYEKEQLKLQELSEKNFVTYFKDLAHKRKASNHDNWLSAYKYLENFTSGELKFKNLTEKFCNEFKEYLLTTKSNKSEKSSLAPNSALSYFNKLKASLNQAYKDGLLRVDINKLVEPIKPTETQRSFLTLEELNLLVKTKCENPILKRAALFSALTGLRFSDIHKLSWNELEFIEGNGYFIKFKQKKTKGVEMLPISNQAYNILEPQNKSSEKVFNGLVYSAYSNKHLAKWIGLAGITKNITFHCFRHTYATLQLSKGTDIYTVSKMLGHRELKTTQVYAKIIDQTKRDASARIELDI